MDNDDKLILTMNKSQRLILGILVLFLVDVIWVSSIELSQYIFREAAFKKPFFSTYVNISLLTLYLLGLCFWPSWKDQCHKTPTYMFIDPTIEDDNFYSEGNITLSNPTFVPIKKAEQCDRSSGTESDDSTIRAVRFSKLAEVRHMSEGDATEALLSRLSYQASIRVDEHVKRQAYKFSIQKVAKIALMFCFLLFTANYTYQAALTQARTGIVTILSSTSSLFTLIFATFFPSVNTDKFTLSKLMAVLINVLGLALIGSSNVNVESSGTVIRGITLSIISAFSYATYVVFLKRKVDHEDRMDLPMFFGFIGLFNLTLLWPLFFIFHYGRWEEFEWPNNHQWTFLIVNGLIGTVLSEVLWLWGCFLTSSLIATLAVSLLLPMSIIADVLIGRIEYSYILYVGMVPAILAFTTACFLAHYDNWDPVMDLLKYFHSWILKKNRSGRTPDLEIEQTEFLISVNSEDHEA